MISWYIDSNCITFSTSSAAYEEPLRGADPLGQCGYLLFGVVHVERRPRARLDLIPAVQRPGAVMPRPHRDAKLVEHLPDIVRMNAIHGERDRAATIVGVGGAEDPHTGDIAEGRQRMG